jgi:YD repeat-containing protein
MIGLVRPLGNLVRHASRHDTFDPAKPTQVIAVSGGALGGGKLTYGYDAIGNQVARPEGKVVYNDFNLPARLTTQSGAPTASFLYDAAGQRVRKSSASETITYLPELYERHRKAEGPI